MATPKKREISVIERRLKSGSVFATGSRPIPLKHPKQWTARVVNSQISDNRLYEMQADKGWQYLEPDDLAVKPEEIGFRVLDGKVVRGTQGQEVLMKMDISDYKAIQKAKDAETRTATFGDQANKAAIVGAAASQLQDGGRGAEYLDRHVAGITVTDSVERVSLEE